MTYKGFLDRIKQQRLDSYGNYDAMFGKVTNFHWSFNKDGSYDIILDLISVGDIVESFKVKGNSLSIDNTSNQPNTEENKNKPTILDDLKKYAPTNDITDHLYKASLLFQQQKGTQNYVNDVPSKIEFNTQSKNNPGSTKDICFVVSYDQENISKFD